MFQTYEAAFDKHNVLRAQALNDSLNGAVKTIEQIYAGYSDGILKEVHIEQEANSIILKWGVVIYQGKIYYLDKEIRIPICQSNEKQILKIGFQEMQYKDGLKKWTTDIVLDENEVTRSNEMELCRFQYQPGAKLRNIYGSFKDFTVAYNVINILHAPYAAYGESTISPKITEKFGEEMLQRELKDPYDIVFCLECQRGEAVSRRSIIRYIEYKLHINKSNISNYEIYTYLSRILESNHTSSMGERPRMREQRRIII